MSENRRWGWFFDSHCHTVCDHSPPTLQTDERTDRLTIAILCSRGRTRCGAGRADAPLQISTQSGKTWHLPHFGISSLSVMRLKFGDQRVCLLVNTVSTDRPTWYTNNSIFLYGAANRLDVWGRYIVIVCSAPLRVSESRLRYTQRIWNVDKQHLMSSAVHGK